MDATDRLRRMLDELGIEWWHDDDISPGHTEWMTDDAAYTSLGMDGDMLSVKAISKMTPEQAIAATVGERNPDGLPIGLTVSNDGNLLNWVGENYVRQDAATVGRGNLTAEQVREAIERHSAWVIGNNRCFHDGAYEEIADELNATVGRCDTMGLWTEWEQVLFANVSDEVAQDNLNECVHELLYKAATMGVGTLTAEQVRECSKGVYFEGYSDGATHRVNGIEETDWQAIADKLNATVGAGTCHIEVHDNLAETEGMGDVWLECDECHWQMPLEPTTPRFKHCPNCRREVVRK